MKPIQTKEQLLIHLAGNGDPSAFYTLIVPYANAAYVAERNSGKKHSESLSALLPTFRKMYQNFISNPTQLAFKEWFKEQEKKYLSASQEVAIESLDKTGFQNLLAGDIIHFDWALNLILQRHYGKFRRAKKRGAAPGPFAFFKRGNRFFKSAVLTGSIVLFIVGSYVCLTFSKAQIAVSFVSSQTMHTQAFPWITHNSFQANPFSRPGAVTRENTPSETPSSQSFVLHDTIKIHDTVRIFNRPKPPISMPDGGKPNISSTTYKTTVPSATPTVKKLGPDSLK